MITITTENKRFTLKTDSDQSDKLFNEIVRHLIGRKPSGGAVMNTRRVNEVSYVDDKRYVLEHIDRRTLLEQLAEEAAELSQAALKLIRAEKLSDNPTPANVSIASEQLNEELADVLVTADAVGIPVLESCDNSKWRRWAARIRKEREM